MRGKRSEDAIIILDTIQEKGAFVGEMSVIDIQAHSADVRSRGPTKLLTFSKKNLVSFCDTYPDAFQIIALNLTRTLSLRLRNK